LVSLYGLVPESILGVEDAYKTPCKYVVEVTHYDYSIANHHDKKRLLYLPALVRLGTVSTASRQAHSYNTQIQMS